MSSELPCIMYVCMYVWMYLCMCAVRESKENTNDSSGHISISICDDEDDVQAGVLGPWTEWISRVTHELEGHWRKLTVESSEAQRCRRKWRWAGEAFNYERRSVGIAHYRMKTTQEEARQIMPQMA